MSSATVREEPVRTDGYVSSGPSPTRIHLLGPGQIGRAFLRQLPPDARVVCVSDSSGSLYQPDGLNPREVAAFKDAGGRLCDHPDGAPLETELAASLVTSDVVVDATPTDPHRAHAASQRARTILDSGRGLVLAAKAAIAADPALITAHDDGARLGLGAVLAGAGRALQDDLSFLRRHATALRCVPNASTSCVADRLASGESPEQAVAFAQRAGLLEVDPTLDLEGHDAAVKLAIVASAWSGRAVAWASIVRPSFDALDVAQVRRDAARGLKTRLVGRATRDGDASLAWESVPRASILAAPATRVVYEYELAESDVGSAARRVHVGTGLGPEAVAKVLWDDVAVVRQGVSR